MSILLTDVDLRKDKPYTLYFTYITSDERHGNTHKFKYTGSEVIAEEFDETAREEIKKQLNKLYNHGPFKKEIIKEIFNDSNKQLKW